MVTNNIPVWELLQKQIIWNQLNFIHNKKVLDFGSGRGITASHLQAIMRLSQLSQILKCFQKELLITNILKYMEILRI